ncbi:hypothetical protein SPAR68_1441 [Streptococcus pneumoniae GA41301]|nr:hypothetical protein SPAR68_1441 [Streptococcus pneumoniae GA41301]
MIYLLAWGALQKTSFSHAPNIQQVQLLPVDAKLLAVRSLPSLASPCS